MSGTFGDSTVIANRFSKMYVNGFVDVSYGNVLLRGDAGPNHLILQGGDISLNGRLFSTRDISLNGNLNIGGNLSVSQFSSNKTITTTNYQLIVSEDLSLNGRLFVSGNVGIGPMVASPQYTLDVSAASTAPFRVGVGSTNALVVNSSGNVGIGTTNPQSALDVTGAIRVSGGITPTYSTPSFSAGQIGYQFTSSNLSLATSVTGGTINASVYTSSSIPIGVWLITGGIGFGTATAQVRWGLTLGTQTYYQTAYYPSNGNSFDAIMSAVFVNTTSQTASISFYTTATTTVNSAYITCTRIA